MQFEKLSSDLMVNHIFGTLTNGGVFNLARALTGHKEFKALTSCYFAITTIGGLDQNDFAHFARVFFDGLTNTGHCTKLMRPMIEYEWGKCTDAMLGVQMHPDKIKQACKLYNAIKGELLTPGFRAKDKSIDFVEDEIAPPPPLYDAKERAEMATFGW